MDGQPGGCGRRLAAMVGAFVSGTAVSRSRKEKTTEAIKPVRDDVARPELPHPRQRVSALLPPRNVE